jgi:DNA polymerase III alpha subunit
MSDLLTTPPRAGDGGPPRWPRPPACLPAAWLDRPPSGARVCVAGLVLVRQRPGTAKGVIFLTLEDETGVVNVIVWRGLYERFRRAVIAGRMLRVTGRLQRESAVVHVIAEAVEDISHMLDDLLLPPEAGRPATPDPDPASQCRPPRAALTPERCRAADQPGTTRAEARMPAPDWPD